MDANLALKNLPDRAYLPPGTDAQVLAKRIRGNLHDLYDIDYDCDDSITFDTPCIYAPLEMPVPVTIQPLSDGTLLISDDGITAAGLRKLNFEVRDEDWDPLLCDAIENALYGNFNIQVDQQVIFLPPVRIAETKDIASGIMLLANASAAMMNWIVGLAKRELDKRITLQ